MESESDLEVVAEAADGSAAVAVTHCHKPDVVLMDIRMPVLDGLAATRQIIDEGSAARVLVLTTFDLDEYVFEALRAGASGFFLKDATAKHLLAATGTIAAGDSLLDPAVTRRVVDAFVSVSPSARIRPTGHVEALAARETEVLRLPRPRSVKLGDR